MGRVSNPVNTPTYPPPKQTNKNKHAPAITILYIQYCAFSAFIKTFKRNIMIDRSK